jgi:hypothetical protein
LTAEDINDGSMCRYREIKWRSPDPSDSADSRTSIEQGENPFRSQPDMKDGQEIWQKLDPLSRHYPTKSACS